MSEVELSRHELSDLTDLAISRCSMAIQSVEQCIDLPEQVHLMMMTVLCSLAVGAAAHAKDHTTGDLTLKEHYAAILMTMAQYAKQRDLDQLTRQQNQ